MSITPNMNLDLPSVSVTLGPEWATLLNAAFALVDTHDHSDGKGVKVTPLGLNINADLDIDENYLTSVGSMRLVSQGSTLVTAQDLRSIYSVSGDLYYNNGAGTAIQITNGGSVTAASDGISREFDRASVNSNTIISAAGTTSFYDVDTTSGVTFTLPAANGVSAGRFYEFKDTTGSAGTNNIVINRAGSDTIDGATSKTISYNYGSMRLVSDGTSKWGVANLINPLTTGGDLPYATTGGVLARLANGTSGQFLTSQGGTSAPQWTSPVAASARGNNMIINGAMETWQRNTTFSPGAGVTYTADRFLINRTASGTVTVNRTTSAPASADIGYPIAASHETVIGTGSSNASGDFLSVEQRIEGTNISDFIAGPFTFSFWAYCSQTATLAVRLMNSATDLYYISNFTINAANTWEKKTITVSTPTSLSGFSFGTTLGMYATICLGTGTANQTSTLNAWTSGAALGSTTQTQLYTVPSAVFRTTGWKIEAGSLATNYLPFGRSYTADLNAMFRYYLTNTFWGVSTAWSGTSTAGTTYISTGVNFPVLMRATPTLTLTNQSNTGFPAGTGATDLNASGYRETRTASSSLAGAQFRSTFTSADIEL